MKFKKRTHKQYCKSVSKRVAKCDKKTGKILKRYPSIYAAVMSLGKNKNWCGVISNCCNGIAYKSVLGFKWKFI